MRSRQVALLAVLAALSVACGSDDGDGSEKKGAGACTFTDDPGGFEALSGPGGPKASFSASELDAPCAFLDGGEVTFPENGSTLEDPDHHNLAFIYDGYLLMPWAPEWADGGISVFDVSDACSPSRVANLPAFGMRETHAVGFSDQGGRWMAVAHTAGLQFWDVTDPAAMSKVGDFFLEGSFYPDAYARVVMSLFWQAPYVYVAHSDNGLKVVDATDPANPELVTSYTFDPPLRAGAVFAVGNLLAVMASEGTRTVLLDISDPADPRPVPGGTYEIVDGDGVPRAAYHAHFNGDKAFYARKDMGGGLIIYDVSNPEAPTFLGDFVSAGGGGGYVFIQDQYAFTGQTGTGDIIDISDPSSPRLFKSFELVSDKGVERPGDFDTLLPLGNVAIAASDDSEDFELDGQATQLFPFLEAPDEKGPSVTMVNPPDGATDVALTSRIGLTFSEFVENKSLWRASVRVQAADCPVPLEGTYSGQEGITNFWPAEPLQPATTYEVVIPAGGVIDVMGNPVETEFRSTFTTAEE